MDGTVFVFVLLYLVLYENKIYGTILNDVKEPLFKSAVPEFSRHTLVEPVIYKNSDKLVSTFTQGGHIDNIVIQFEGFSTNFTLDLKRNSNLFSKSYIEKSYSSKGDHVHRPAKHKEAHCFYHGHIRDFRHSMVALSTCDGISGYINDGQESYHIEPAYDISSTTHRLFKDSDSLRKNFRCGAHPHGHSNKINETHQILHRNEILHRMRREVRGPYDFNTNTRFVEMYIVNDYKTYISNMRNVARQIHITQGIINIVSKLYQPFSIHIALVGIENWTERDLFTITSEADSTLENFLHYRRSRINPYHPNDNAQLITDTTFTHGVVGKAIKGTICTFQYSGGINENLAAPGQTAATIAHELGHNFGMDHDNYTFCQCRDDKCIMAATSGGVSTPTHWSSCSMQALQDAFEMGMDYCLKNRPDKLYGDGPVCGNGFTEDGEECDCGLPEVCDNKCCNATTCKLTPNSLCATGLCCDLDKCQPKKAATMCRAPTGECDLPEFCWGDSQYCPEDVFLEDGVECYNGQSYCYKGQCKTHTGQCKLLWGTTGRVSDPVCFKNLNTNGSKHGNCGYNWTTSQYIPCKRDDTMCGLLHCVHQNEKLMFWKDNLAHATPATFLTIGPRTYICRGAMLDVGLDMPDPGMVPEGAKCEDRKICVNHTCTALSLLGIPKCERGCSQRGRCNSNGNCHCDEGFGPPHCDIGGNGGSVDSGPIKVSDSNGLLIALLVLFLVVMPLIGIAAFLMFRYRVALLAWWNKHISSLNNKQTSRPQRPSHPPPKRDPTPATNLAPARPTPVSRPTVEEPTPPAYDPKWAPNRVPPRTTAPSPSVANKPRPPPHDGHVAVVISEPVLTGSTHKDSKSHIQPSPKPPTRPLLPTAPSAQGNSTRAEVTQEVDPSLKLPTKAEPKSRFGPIFKKPNIGKSQETASPKLPEKKPESAEPEVVKRRELTREISNPVLISTTDRRSKHLVKLDNIQMSVLKSGEAPSQPPPVPPVPPKISLTKSDSDRAAKRNKPLPPRPVSMPVSESGEEPELDVKEARKSMNFPQRPPPPPVKPNVTDTRQTIEQEISKLDQIKVEIPEETKSDNVKSKTSKPSAVAKTPTKEPLQPKTAVKKSTSDSTKKPAAVKKTPATQSKSDPKWTPVDKPIFKPKDKPKKTSHSPASKAGQSESSKSGALKTRKPSTDSLDEEGTTSVYARKKIFEGQKKPLLGAKSTPSSTPSVPQTPPKPAGRTVNKVRSVDV